MKLTHAVVTSGIQPFADPVIKKTKSQTVFNGRINVEKVANGYKIGRAHV